MKKPANAAIINIKVGSKNKVSIIAYQLENIVCILNLFCYINVTFNETFCEFNFFNLKLIYASNIA